MHKESSEIMAINDLRSYLKKSFGASFFTGLSLEKDKPYISDVLSKYPSNPSAIIALGYMEWRFGNRTEASQLFEKAYKIAKDSKYDLKWFEIGVNTFLSSIDEQVFIEPKLIVPDFQHHQVAANISPVILASCDEAYFQQFGRSFIDICLKHSKGAVHIHVINPGESTLDFFAKRKGNRLSFSSEQSENKFKAYYALSRFLIAPLILDIYDTDILVVDIDQAMSRNVDDIFKSLASDSIDIAVPIFNNAWMPWNYYLAGNVYLKNNSRVKAFMRYFVNYTNQAVIRLGSYDGAWFIDQNAMYKSISFLEKSGGTIGRLQSYGRIAIGPEGLGKKPLARLLQKYNDSIDFSGKSKITDEDEFLLALKPFLKNRALALMFFESFYNSAK